jgi:hypothetical protein
MKQLFFAFLIALFSCLNAFSQQDKLLDLITSSLWIYDTNPVHVDESQKINIAFVDVVNANKNGTGENSKSSRVDIFKLLYENGLQDPVNDIDFAKSRLRKAVCFTAVSMLSDKDRYKFFLDLAKHCMSDSLGNPNSLLLKEYLGLMLVDIFLKNKFKIDNKAELKELDIYVEHYKDIMAKEFYYNAKIIIELYKK